MIDNAVLVFTLPEEKRTEKDVAYGRHMGRDRDPQPVCMVKADGEVWMYNGATLTEVKVVLSCFPYLVEFEELRQVRVPEEPS